MNRLVLLTVCVLVFFLVLGVVPVNGEEDIYNNVIRLHVLANSDSEADQDVKLAVRDAILEYCTPYLRGCGSREEAQGVILLHAAEIEGVAQRVLAENGFGYSARVVLGEEEYPTRTYDSLCFPSGKYLSCRVLLGEAEGKNWWCVLFPPLCLSAATARGDAESAFIKLGFSEDQYKIITETDNVKYKLRFKILEMIEGTK